MKEQESLVLPAVAVAVTEGVRRRQVVRAWAPKQSAGLNAATDADVDLLLYTHRNYA